MTSLNVLWYWLVGAIFAGYAVLDGFDLGVGTVHLLAPTDRDRRIVLEAIGPVWDGNEVWLVVGGGALFAAFPPVYATVFSGFYLAMMLLLLALLFRAVSIEFRSRRPERWWSRTWDVAFSVASVLASLLLGAALGNAIRGIALDPAGNYTGTFLDLLNPYALLTAIATLALFTMHGAVYLVLRTEGPLRTRARGWAGKAMVAFLVVYAAVTAVTLRYVPHLAEHVRERPWLWAIPPVILLAMAGVVRGMRRGRCWRAFLSSCAAVLGVLLLVGASMFPVLVFATDPARSLTAYNASSTPKTLRIMLIMAAIGLPLTFAYTIVIYRLFRGKVKLDAESC